MSSISSTNNNSISDLPNETDFIALTEQLLEFSARTHAKASMLFITFDSKVEEINTAQNDLALDAISNRLLSKARESDIYAHLGGMNFANLSIETSEQHASILVEKLKNELAEPIVLSDGSLIKLNAKIGAAQFPTQGENYQALVDYAKNNIV
ncbi:MAG: diguanylate phosphodiesterase [Cycloclasticus sp.]|nr:MAG: diguanylate phosphodiesterase [Cycloclasticus sp.]